MQVADDGVEKTSKRCVINQMSAGHRIGRTLSSTRNANSSAFHRVALLNARGGYTVLKDAVRGKESAWGCICQMRQWVDSRFPAEAYFEQMVASSDILFTL